MSLTKNNIKTMKHVIPPKQILLSGKVVQTFEISGEKIAKIYIEPASIDLLVELNEEVRLGDILAFEVSIDDNSINPINNIKNQPAKHL